MPGDPVSEAGVQKGQSGLSQGLALRLRRCHWTRGGGEDGGRAGGHREGLHGHLGAESPGVPQPCTECGYGAKPQLGCAEGRGVFAEKRADTGLG